MPHENHKSYITLSKLTWEQLLPPGGWWPSSNAGRLGPTYELEQIYQTGRKVIRKWGISEFYQKELLGGSSAIIHSQKSRKNRECAQVTAKSNIGIPCQVCLAPKPGCSPYAEPPMRSLDTDHRGIRASELFLLRPFALATFYLRT